MPLGSPVQSGGNIQGTQKETMPLPSISMQCFSGPRQDTSQKPLHSFTCWACSSADKRYGDFREHSSYYMFVCWGEGALSPTIDLLNPVQLHIDKLHPVSSVENSAMIGYLPSPKLLYPQGCTPKFNDF